MSDNRALDGIDTALRQAWESSSVSPTTIYLDPNALAHLLAATEIHFDLFGIRFRRRVAMHLRRFAEGELNQ